MRITILAYGSRGDVQPYVALGAGLQEAGHQVRLAAPEAFAGLAAQFGLAFAPYSGDPAGLMAEVVTKAGGRPNLITSARVVLGHALPLARQVIRDTRQACQGADVIIHSMLLTTVGHEVALEMGIQDLSALVFPIFGRPGGFPNMAFPELPLGGWYNRLTHQLFNRFFWLGSRTAYNWSVGRRHPELLKLTQWPFAPKKGQPTPILYGFSSLLLPRPLDFGPRTHVTGYWTLDTASNWQPPAALTAFLDAGSRPVFVGFGSVISEKAQGLTRTVVEALGRTGQRGVLVRGWGGLGPAQVPENVLMIEGAPYDWLLPRCSAAIIHGGIGTTAATVRAGLPAVVIPFAADQTFWGERLHGSGAAPRPIPAKRLTAQRLTEALEAILGDNSLRQTAVELGRSLAAEDGIGRAVNVIEGYVGAAG